MRLLAILSISIVTLCAASVLSAQDNRTRFEMSVKADTSFDIALGSVKWVKKGMVGTVVDPRKNFDLVATFRVANVEQDTARAIVMGLTTTLAPHHVALISAPRRSWLSQKFFWIGGGVGLVAGFLIGKG